MKITQAENGLWLPDQPIKVKLSEVMKLCPEMQHKFMLAEKVGICRIVDD